MARVPEVIFEKIFLARGIHCYPVSSRSVLLYYEEYMYIQYILYTCEGVDVVCDYHYYQLMLRVNNVFTQTTGGEKLLVA
jgi:hypothetical protein